MPDTVPAGFANIKVAKVAIFEEAVRSVLETGADYLAVNLATMSLTPVFEEVIPMETGFDGPTAHEFSSLYYTGSITLQNRFEDVETLVALGMRDDPVPTEASVVFVGSEITLTSVSPGIAHLDGSTGAQLRIVGTPGAFAAALAASSNLDLDNLVFRLFGTGTAFDWDDIGYKNVKPGNPRTDGGDEVLDLYDNYFQNTTGGFGSDWTTTPALNGTVDFGAAVRNKVVTPSGNKTHSMLVYLSDVDKWIALTGVQFAMPTFNFPGRAESTITLNFIADKYTPVTDVDPVGGSSPGSIDSSAVTFNPQILGGAGIREIYLGSDTRGVRIAGCHITNLVIGGEGDWIPIIDRLGSNKLCGTLGASRTFTASFSYNLTDAPDATSIAKILQDMGQIDNNEEAYLDVFTQDKKDGNQNSIRVYGTSKPNSLLSFGGTTSAPLTGDFALGVFERTPGSSGHLVYTRWANGRDEL